MRPARVDANTADPKLPARRLAPLRGLAPFVRPHRRLIVLALLALGVAASASLVLPVAARQVIDRGFHAGVSEHISRYFFGLLAVVAGVGPAAPPPRFPVPSRGWRGPASTGPPVFKPRLAPASPVFWKGPNRGLLF